MKALRVTLAVLALLALPFVGASAQGRSGESKCNVAATRSAGKAQGQGLATAPGQLKGCPAPNQDPNPDPDPDPVPQPPTGPHSIQVVVYEDVDGDGSWNMYAGELGLANAPLQLWWNGRIIAEAVSDANGIYEFLNLGNTTYSVCVGQLAGYNRTEPAAGNACSGAGYEVVVAGAFGTRFDRFFGFMLQ